MGMSKNPKGLSGAAIAAGAAIGSAAIAGALLYANRRRKDAKDKREGKTHSAQGGTIPSGEDPQTD